jgi:hypothetical protein
MEVVSTMAVCSMEHRHQAIEKLFGDSPVTKQKAPHQTIDLAGLRISLKTYGELNLFFNIADGFESLSDVAERAFGEWLAQQGAAIRMHQIDVQFFADHCAVDDVRTDEINMRVRKGGRKARALPSNLTCINASPGFRTEK